MGAQNNLYSDLADAKAELYNARRALLSADTSQFKNLIDRFNDLENYFFEKQEYVDFAQSFADKGELNMREGRSRVVIDSVNILLEKIPHTDSEALAILYTAKGYAQEVEGEIENAFESYSKAKDLLEGFSNNCYYILAELGQLSINHDKWKTNEVENGYRNIIEELKKNDRLDIFNKNLLATAYYLLGDIIGYKAMIEGNSRSKTKLLNTSKVYIIKGLELASLEYPENLLTGLINNSLALNYWMSAKNKNYNSRLFDQSEEIYNKSIYQIHKFGGKKYFMFGRIENNLAMTYEDRWIGDLVIDLNEIDPNLKTALMDKEYFKLHNHKAWELIFESNKLGFEKALSQYLKSLKIKEKYLVSNHSFIMRNCNNLSSLLILSGRYQEALEYAQHSISINQDNRVKILPDQLGVSSINDDKIIDIVQLLRSVYWKSQTQKNIIEQEMDSIIIYQKSKELLSTYAEIIRLLELMITGYSEVKSQTEKLNRYKDIYEDAIDVCTNLYYHTNETQYYEMALIFIEKSKANLSRILIKNSKALKYIDTTLAKKDSLLQSEIVKVRTLKNAEMKSVNKNDAKINELISKERKMKLNYDLFVDKIEKSNPLFSEIKYKIANPKLNEIQNKIINNIPSSMLLNFYVGFENIFIAAVTENRKEIFKIRERDEVIKLASEIREAMFDENSAIDNYKDDFEKFRKRSSKLYNLLFNSIREIDILNDIDHLIFLPSGKLSLFPFEVLLTPDENNVSDDYNKLNYLFEKYNISYAYSLSSLEKSFDAKESSENEIDYLGFACSNYRDKANGNLTQASVEVEFGKSIFDGVVYIEKEATENTIKKIGVTPKILHLAMHTELDTVEYDASSFLFCDEEASQADEEDGKLHAYEIYQMADLFRNTELACLTACNTGTGTEIIGEGIMSLSNTFTNLNCKSVLMSLWPLSDVASSKIMPYFLQNIKDGLSKSEALRNAKLKYLEDGENVHPYYWAPLILTGNDLAMDFTEKKSVFSYLYLLFFGVLSLCLGWIKRKSIFKGAY